MTTREKGAGIGAVGRFGLAARSSGASHQSQLSNALSVVSANDGRGREIGRTQAKVPDNVAAPVNLDHTVVELISDEDVAGSIERLFLGSQQKTGCEEQ